MLAAASLGLVAAVGGLFVTGALDPVVTDVMASFDAEPVSDGSETLNAGPVADWMYNDDVPDWSSVRGVPEVPRPAQPAEPTRPSVQPPEKPHRFLFSGQPPMPRYYLEGPDDCMQPHNPYEGVANFVVKATGSGSASVRWWDMGDPDTQYYQVVAVPQYVNQFDYSRNVPDPPKKYTQVAATKGCKQMSTTVTGLQVGFKYNFSLMGYNKSPLNGRQYSITRAVSETITIT